MPFQNILSGFSSLTNDFFGSGDLFGAGHQRYPLDTHSQVGSKVVFQAIKVQAPSAPITFTKSSTFNEISGGGGGGGFSFFSSNTMGALGSGFSQASGRKIIPLSGERASLFLPISFQVNEGFQYSGVELGAKGGAVLNAFNSGNTSIASSLMQSVKTGATSLSNFFTGGTFTGDAAKIGAAMGAELMPGGVGDAVRLTAGVKINPNLRTKFDGVNIRDFTFTFKFIPKSQKESIAIRNIIKFFRIHAYPKELPGNGQFPIALEYPNMFKIKLKTQVGGTFKNVGTPIKYSYLRTISTTYNPTSAVLHPDGAPNEIDLSLNFTEYKPLSRHDVAVEDNDDAFDQERKFAPYTGGAEPVIPEFPDDTSSGPR